MSVFVVFFVVLKITMCVVGSSGWDDCAPRDCTKEFIPVCAKSPDTGAEWTFPNNCTRLFLGCRHEYLRDGKCTEDEAMFERLAGIGDNIKTFG